MQKIVVLLWITRASYWTIRIPALFHQSGSLPCPSPVRRHLLTYIGRMMRRKQWSLSWIKLAQPSLWSRWHGKEASLELMTWLSVTAQIGQGLIFRKDSRVFQFSECTVPCCREKSVHVSISLSYFLSISLTFVMLNLFALSLVQLLIVWKDGPSYCRENSI